MSANDAPAMAPPVMMACEIAADSFMPADNCKEEDISACVMQEMGPGSNMLLR